MEPKNQIIWTTRCKVVAKYMYTRHIFNLPRQSMGGPIELFWILVIAFFPPFWWSKVVSEEIFPTNWGHISIGKLSSIFV